MDYISVVSIPWIAKRYFRTMSRNSVIIFYKPKKHITQNSNGPFMKGMGKDKCPPS